MKYTHRHATCDTSDRVNVGWVVDSNATRARLTKHNRWQGSRDSIVVTSAIDAPLTENTAKNLAEKLERAFGCGVLSLRRGDSAWGFRVQSTGHVVR